jgi:hypothetical protein
MKRNDPPGEKVTRVVARPKVQKTKEEKEAASAKWWADKAAREQKKAEEKAKAEAEAERKAFWAETPEVIEAQIKAEDKLHLDAAIRDDGAKVKEHADNVKKLKQKLAEKKAFFKDYNEKLLQSSPATLEELQFQISKLRELEQAEPNNEAVKRALEDKQWRARDLKQRKEEEDKENDRLRLKAAKAARREQAIEANDPSELNPGEREKWWETDGKRQAEKRRIQKCREEIEKARMAEDAPAEPEPAEGEEVSLPSSSLSPEEWEQELNERLKKLNAKEVAEAAKRAEADRKEFGDCYR